MKHESPSLVFLCILLLLGTLALLSLMRGEQPRNQPQSSSGSKKTNWTEQRDYLKAQVEEKLRFLESELKQQRITLSNLYLRLSLLSVIEDRRD